MVGIGVFKLVKTVGILFAAGAMEQEVLYCMMQWQANFLHGKPMSVIQLVGELDLQ